MDSFVVLAEFGKIFGRKFQGRGRGVLLQMRDRRYPRDRAALFVFSYSALA